MALFDLRKRRSARKDQPDSEPLTAEPIPAAAQAMPPAAIAVALPAVPAVADPAGNALALGETPMPPAPPVEWAPALQDQALGLLGRNQDVLVLGLAPWGTATWPQKLMGRARSVVAVDPDKARLIAVRAYCHKIIDAPLEGPEWLARLGGQRFASVILGDALTHLPDPVGFLRRVREVMAPDGQLIAVVPNASWGEHRLELLQGEVPREYEPGGQLHRYNYDRLREALALAGFAIGEAQPHRTGLFEAGSQLVPELFPDAVVQALGVGGQETEDPTVSHFVVRALPVGAEALLRTLFGEQEQLRKAVRNELAKARRTQDTLAWQLKESDATREALSRELEDHKKKVTGLNELTARAEQNIRRLGKEVDDAQRELRAVHASLAYRLMTLFRAKPKAPAEPAGGGPTEWKVEEPKSRYL